MANTTWDNLQRACQRKERYWRAHCEALRNRVARLHPETGGHIGLVHNWGNPAAREAVAKAGAAWRRYADSADKRINALMRDYSKGL